MDLGQWNGAGINPIEAALRQRTVVRHIHSQSDEVELTCFGKYSMQLCHTRRFKYLLY